MPMTYQIRPLGSLPWPSGLGKHGSRYGNLEHELRALLGDDDFWDTEAHRRAFVSGDPDYRRIVLKELGQLPWSADVVDGVDAATALARSSPLLNQPLDSEAPWLNWAAPHRDNYPVWAWLTNGLNASDTVIGDGRHRLTYLRYHRPPEHEVLVRIET